MRSTEQTEQAISALLSSTNCWDLVARFLFTFSRFEYALKESGYARTSKYGVVEPHWDKFAEQLPNFRSIRNPDFKAALKYLIYDPPKRQVLRNGRVVWESQKQKAENNVQVLQLVRQVRNNTFHGGKIPFTEDRDRRLLNAALAVLVWALRNDFSVYSAFFSPFVYAAA